VSPLPDGLYTFSVPTCVLLHNVHDVRYVCASRA
jgi:hypothetical protein